MILAPSLSSERHLADLAALRIEVLLNFGDGYGVLAFGIDVSASGILTVYLEHNC